MPRPTPILYTKEGYSELHKEYETLQSARPEYVKELTKAADMGDRSENAAYKYAKQKLRSTDSRLRYLKKVLDRAKIVESSQSEYVEIGSKVIVNNGSKDISFRIVGGNESNPSQGLLSYLSPLGQALLRKKAGDTVKVITLNGEVDYSIKSIE